MKENNENQHAVSFIEKMRRKKFAWLNYLHLLTLSAFKVPQAFSESIRDYFYVGEGVHIKIISNGFTESLRYFKCRQCEQLKIVQPRKFFSTHFFYKRNCVLIFIILKHSNNDLSTEKQKYQRDTKLKIEIHFLRAHVLLFSLTINKI